MELIVHSLQFIQYYILPFIVVLGVMIFFHELGHFLVAKYFGVKVLKFALGFGPILVKRTWGETEYSIRYFPLGGFVKMLGEDIETEEDEAPLPGPEDEQKYFNKKNPLKRMAIVVAGPTFNLVLALLMYCGSFMISGETIPLPEIGQVTEESPAHGAGFLKGDIITEIEGNRIESWTDIKAFINDKAGIPLVVTVKRGGEYIHLTVTPEEAVGKNEFGEDVKSSVIGIVAAGTMGKIDLGPWQAMKRGAGETYRWIIMTFVVAGKLLQGEIPINNLGGPILIGQMTGQIVREDISYIVPFMAIISINLGILNLFPIPVLDGGLILFLLIELMIGRPLSVKKREMAMKIGLTLLIALMLTMTYNDITRIIQQFFG